MDLTGKRPTLPVVAAVLHDGHGRVLIAQRPAGKPLAGFWEFPGGKLEAGESPRAALQRELHEELGINVEDARPLIHFAHDYPERRVELDVWRVTRYTGSVHPREQQALAWVDPGTLGDWDMLPADLPITRILRLPTCMLVTPHADLDSTTFLEQLQRSLVAGVELVQLRAPGLDGERYRELARQVITLCREQAARVVLNAAPELAEELGADGAHLNSQRLRRMAARPVPAPFLIGASCHDAAELEHARSCKLDYAVLGPVLATISHPDATPLGWEWFAQLAAGTDIPVYAIGGMRVDHLEQIRARGGYGLAAIRGLWDGRHETV